jgi:hypothetical protein
MTTPMPPDLPPPPPGFLSPAAFPFPGGPCGLPNDAPPATPQPYLIGTFATNGNQTSGTITVRSPTNPNDAIVVFATAGGSGTDAPVSCTDTKGNAYSVFGKILSGDSAVFIAQKTAALSPANGDSITFTWSVAHQILGIAVGVPASAVGAPPGSWLTYDLFNQVGQAGTASLSAPALPATGAPGVPEVVLAFSSNGTVLTGPAAFGQDFTVLANASWTIATAFTGAVAYKVALNGIAPNSTVVWTQQQSGGASGLTYITLRPETRFAPNKPAPDMPPGMQAPGAWQFTPAKPTGNLGPTAHYGTPSLIVVPSFSAARTRGRFRTGSLTVTPAFSAARTRGRFRTGSLTVTPAFSAARTRGRFRTGSLIVVPSFSAARLAAHLPAGSLLIVPSFTAARRAAHNPTSSLLIVPSFFTGARHVVPTPIGSWWALDSVFKQSRREFESYVSRPPMACPKDGEPLTYAPATKSGSGIERYCKYCGWSFPRDWSPPTRPMPW